MYTSIFDGQSLDEPLSGKTSSSSSSTFGVPTGDGTVDLEDGFYWHRIRRLPKKG